MQLRSPAHPSQARRSAITATLLGLALTLALTGCPTEEVTLEGLEIAITPAEPTLEDDLVVVITTDADAGDSENLTYSFEWAVDGDVQSDLLTDTVPGTRTSALETWTVEVTPHLPTLDGPPANASVTLPDVVITDDDEDGDGFEGPDGDGSDCDDTNPAINPDADEVCNDVDDDCSGEADDLGDGDNDGVLFCDDCDDDDRDNYPGNTEVCDGQDNDCNEQTDEGFPDADGDGFDTCSDCADDNPDVNPDATESCDGFGDDNCDGVFDLNENDADGDGFRPCDGDCDDLDPDLQPTDLDSDGVTSCDGDCDDDDDGRFPGNTEVCDGDDENCDGAVDEGFDVDSDGFESAALCSAGTDCDDNDPVSFPGATEVCDGADNNCDSEVPADEIDGDSDGFLGGSCGADCDDSDPALTPADGDTDGLSSCDGDCDDSDPALNLLDVDTDTFTTCDVVPDCDDGDDTVFPGAAEICDGIDNDCDGAPESNTDGDSDGFTVCDGDCDDDDTSSFPGGTEVCDGADNDCNGTADDGFPNVDGDPVTDCGGDCDDNDPDNYPGNTEVCDDADNNCDDAVDEGFDLDGDGQTTCNGDCDDNDINNFTGNTEVCDASDNDCLLGPDNGLPFTTWFLDSDEDGVGDSLMAESTCDGPPSADHVTTGGDCDDNNDQRFPGNPEVCDDIDNDCNGSADDGLPLTNWYLDADDDGFGVTLSLETTCDGPPSEEHVTSAGDCDDNDNANFPNNPEICDGQDNNCSNTTDEGFDIDGDGFFDDVACPLGDDCNDNNPFINPDAEEVCDAAVDNDCDPLTDEVGDGDADNFSICDGDCDDDNIAANPSATEDSSNGFDDDCDGGVDEFTWTEVHADVIMNNCSCHLGASHSTGLTMGDSSTAYNNLVLVPASELPSMSRVNPDDSTTSYLMHKLDGTQNSVGGFGGQMPLAGCCLDESTRNSIRAWIDTGAAND